MSVDCRHGFEYGCVRCHRLTAPPPPILRFELPARTPSLNVWQRWHWRRQHAYSKNLADEVYWMVYRKAPKATLKRRVVITRRSTGKCDADNRCGGAKALLDALVKAKLLVDDSEQWVDVLYKHEMGSGMLVEVFEIP